MNSKKKIREFVLLEKSTPRKINKTDRDEIGSDSNIAKKGIYS